MEFIITEKKEPTPTVCLNMIVKNESRIIHRMLESVLPIIDTYCICDTGSTDNTKELIIEFFEKRNITGKIVEEPFINFEHNRNVALQACKGMSDYALLMDADMILEMRNFNKTMLLDSDSFFILQGDDNFYYENVRIVKNDGTYKYHGVTHEFIGRDGPENRKKLSKDTIFILDYGDGGCKSDKYERDIRLLKEGIEKEPDNVRYYFYLANSYATIGKNEEAITYYRKRTQIGGWFEEVWYSYFKIGLCYKAMGRMPEAIYAWLEAYNYRPARIENLHEIINHYRIKGERETCLLFYKLAEKILDENKKNGVNKDEFLFLQNDVYTYLLDYEYTIFAFYLGIHNISKQAVAVLNNCKDNTIIVNLFQNMQFYREFPKKKDVIDLSISIEREIAGKMATLASSSSCLIPNKNGNGYLINYRFVDYRITDNGSYICHENKIVTINKYAELDNNFITIPGSEIVFEENDYSRLYTGVEDIRIFDYIDKQGNSDLKFIGTGYHKDDTLGIVIGNYKTDIPVLTPTEIKCGFANTGCEKNWCFVNYGGDTCVIYKWFPLQICKINSETNILESFEIKQGLPMIFRHMRGSTSGFSYNDEIWFVTHIVSYEQPRKYYHCICIFDQNMNLKKYSAPFKFDGEHIEYCVSIVVEEDRVIIPYSTWDRTTKIAVYDKKYLLDEIIIFN